MFVQNQFVQTNGQVPFPSNFRTICRRNRVKVRYWQTTFLGKRSKRKCLSLLFPPSVWAAYEILEHLSQGSSKCLWALEHLPYFGFETLMNFPEVDVSASIPDSSIDPTLGGPRVAYPAQLISINYTRLRLRAFFHLIPSLFNHVIIRIDSFQQTDKIVLFSRKCKFDSNLFQMTERGRG